MRTWFFFTRLAVLAGVLAGCGSSGDTAHPDAAPQDAAAPFDGVSRADLLDPVTCVNCHADHYNDWVGSMHAFAADDPVFVAMNVRGQRETDGGLGTFCVNCHSPMAVRDGMTTDGLNLASLPAKYHGVTCFFCHSISSVDGTHNAAVTLADDLAMRGEIADPVPNNVHQAKYSSLHDEANLSSATMCGACHDIVVPPTFVGDAGASDAGTPIERTFAEWQASAFSGMGGESCTASACHMVRDSTPRPIATKTGYPTTPPSRTFHAHDFPAVDVKVSAGADAASPEPPDMQLLLSDALQGDLCVTARGGIRVIVDTPNLGHDFPSGASQDRRVWAEVIAYQGPNAIYHSGGIPYGAPDFDLQKDPDMWLLRDCIFDTQGQEVHMFWQAASYEGNELPALATFNPADPSFFLAQKVRSFPLSGDPPEAGAPDRVTLQLWVQPIGLDVLNDLVSTGDLDPSVVAAAPKFPVPLSVQLPGSPPSQQLEWTTDTDAGFRAYVDPYDNTVLTCVGTLPGPAPGLAQTHKRCAP